jgi:hypothetical protein
MKTQRFAIVLTVINLGLLCSLWANHSAVAQNAAAAAPAVLTARALEIVDDQGRVRATIKVLEPSARLAKSTVILRLIDPNGRPGVKIFASEDAAGLSFVGDADTTQVLLEANGLTASLKLANKDGKQQLVKP